MKRVFLIAICAFSGIVAGHAQQPAAEVDSSKYSAYWWHSKDMYDHLPDTKNEIIFLGNSITDGAEWFELFGNPRCHNRGISADVTEGVLLRLDAITRLNPSKIFIMIGVNDLSRDMTVDEIVANYRTILERIRKETPRTKVYVESVLPVNPATGMALRHTNKTDLIMQLNGRLRELSDEFGHTYIDLFGAMADENNHLPRSYSIDGLHLSYEGYRVWVEAIKRYVK
jgi:lysophospholipase L1-like esterase